MSQGIRRSRTGYWLMGTLGAIASILGIRYASSSGLWLNSLNPNQPPTQTVSTGANVLVSTTGTPVGEFGTQQPTQAKPTTPLPPNNPQPAQPSLPKRQLW